MKLSGGPPGLIKLVEAYAKAQGMFATAGNADAEYSDTLELDLATVEPSLAGPQAAAGPGAAARRQDRRSARPSRN